MTVRDPYTGVERKMPPRPRSFVERCWPVAVIAAILLIAGIFEWRNAMSSRAPHPHDASATTPVLSTPSPAKPPTLPGAALPQPAASDGIARASAALTRAADALRADSELMLAIAALQVIVLAGQLYVFGMQRRTVGRNAEKPQH